MVVSRAGRMSIRKSRLIRRRIRMIFYTVGMLLSTAAISHASYGFLMEAPYFMVTAPRIEGVSEGVRKELSGLVETFIHGKASLIGINSKELRQQIALHPRVRDIRIDKIYPNQLKISAVEREEVAIAATSNGFYLIDNDCHVMDKLDLVEQSKLDYPYISGLRAETVHEGEPVESTSLKKALTLIQVLKERNPQLYKLLSDVEIRTEKVSPLETLVAHMKGGLDILFGDGNPVEKLPALETLLQKLEGDNVKPFSDLVYIDLSYDKLGFTMDRDTAVLVKRNQFELEQQAMREANEKYAKEHPLTKKGTYDGETAPASSSGRTAVRERESASAGRKSSSRSRVATPAYSIPQSAPQQTAPNYPSHYYPQPQYSPRQQPASMYNVPNQTR